MLPSLIGGIMGAKSATIQPPTYATLNPADKSSDVSLSGGDLVATITINNVWRAARGTIGKSSGKWYFEMVCTDISESGNIARIGVGLGNASANLNNFPGANADSRGAFTSGLAWYNNGSTSLGVTFADDDVISVAADLTAGAMWFAKNGSWLNDGDPATGASPFYSGISGTQFPIAGLVRNSGATQPVLTMNFGASAFSGSVPAGFDPGWYTTS